MAHHPTTVTSNFVGMKFLGRTHMIPQQKSKCELVHPRWQNTVRFLKHHIIDSTSFQLFGTWVGRNKLSLKFGCLWLVDLPMENGRIKEHHIFSVYSLLSLLTVPVRTQALWQMYLLRDQLKKLLAHGLCHPTLMHHTIATWSCLLIQMCLFSVRSTWRCHWKLHSHEHILDCCWLGHSSCSFPLRPNRSRSRLSVQSMDIEGGQHWSSRWESNHL